MNPIRFTQSIGLLALASTLFLLASCRDSTAPQAAAQVGSIAHPTNWTNEGFFDDATERIIPAMRDQESAMELRESLVKFSAAYAGGDAAEARQALTAAQEVLRKLDATEHGASLAALRLSFLQAQSLLDSAAASLPPSP